MRALSQEAHTGLEALRAATALLQRVRNTHPTAGLFEAADLQWWWRTPRSTDHLGQLFWVDDMGRPEAAMIATDWGSRIGLDPVFLPGAEPAWVAHVLAAGLAHARSAGYDTVETEVNRADHVLRDELLRRGFTIKGDGVLEAWLAAAARPPVSPLHDGYELRSRRDTPERPHHMIGRSGPLVQARLQQTSLYRADLDLCVVDQHGAPAAYGLFWFDPATATGLVEPMRTENDHQQRGLARHVLTAGVDLLAAAGAERIKICFEPENVAAAGLYQSVGFEPSHRTELFVGPTGAPAA